MMRLVPVGGHELTNCDARSYFDSVNRALETLANLGAPIEPSLALHIALVDAPKRWREDG